MGFGTLEQLIARGRPSPITSALKGFTGMQAAMQNLQKQRLANQIQAAQAQIAPQTAQAALQKQLLANRIQQAQAGVAPQAVQAKLAQAQALPGLTKAQTQQALAAAQKSLAFAKDPSAAQPLSGPAHDAESNIIFKKRHADNPEDLGELKKATDRVERSANARWWLSVPSDERAQVLGNLKSLGIDQVKATQLLSQGHSEQEIINMHQAAQTPTLTGAAVQPTASNVHNETPATVDKSIQEVKEATKPLKWQDITPNFAPTEAVKTRAQQSAQASAGLDYLGKYIANNLKYGGITSKITRPWLQDIYSSDPAKQEKAVNYYVAQAVKPELALLRIRIQGGQASARAMKALAPTILGTISVDMSNLPAKMQQRVQLKATQVLNEAAYQTEKQTLAPNPNVYNPKIDTSKNISATAPTAAAVPSKAPPSQENLEFTAKTRGITVEEVKRRLGIK